MYQPTISEQDLKICGNRLPPSLYCDRPAGHPSDQHHYVVQIPKHARGAKRPFNLGP